MPLNDTWPSGGTSTVHEAWVEQFKDEVVHLAQQEVSRLRSCVRTDMVRGDVHNFERLGPTDAVLKTTRHTTTPIMDTPHDRRKLVMADYQWADLIDEEDKIRMLIDATGAYTKNAAMAMGRQWDKLIIAAASADAMDGDGNAVALPAGQTIASGGEQMTIGKLTEAKYIMDSNEIDAEGRALIISAQELRSLLNTTEITSSDYNTVKALVNGEVDHFLGFKFIRTELLTDDATDRTCLAIQRDCVGLGIGRDTVARVDQRPDVSYAWQVYSAFSGNATRIQEEGVVEIMTALVPA